MTETSARAESILEQMADAAIYADRGKTECDSSCK
jgi:hypothetical protein